MLKKGAVRTVAGVLLRSIAEAGRSKDSRIEEGHLMLDHVQLLDIDIPKYSVSQVVGYKGKRAIIGRGIW
jgi:putative transposase